MFQKTVCATNQGTIASPITTIRTPVH